MIADVRGKGLIIGIEFRPPRSLGLKAGWAALEAAERGLFTQLVVMSLMRDHRILVQVGGPGVNIVKLLPPLIIGDEEVDQIISAFDAVMGETRDIRGRVWATSAELIKQAVSQ
jgi:4-aminobutyrate aminotransferase-like enzyme